MSVFTRIQPVSSAQGAVRRSQPAFLEPASSAALLLLGEVLARLAAIERPVVQIVAGSACSSAASVARDFAVAAATRFGRTLLVSSTACKARGEDGLRGLSWLMTGTLLGSEPDGITPDPSVPGLYYSSLTLHDQGPLELPVEAWLAGPQAFRMIVIECPAIAADPRTLAVATVSHGSVLAAGAGVTTLSEIRMSARQLASAGVPLLGTVLFDAPSYHLNPLRRAA